VIAGAHPSSWYVASARGLTEYPVLRGALTADVCVVGAGYTGLSTALHLAERGYSVIVLEARRVGWGASGRNGGQIGTGQRCEEAWLEARFGRDTARQLFQLAEESKALVRARISRHAIDCELGFGQLLCAARTRWSVAPRSSRETTTIRINAVSRGPSFPECWAVRCTSAPAWMRRPCTCIH
jgi:gamma-glutamylputrescine oxidase